MSKLQAAIQKATNNNQKAMGIFLTDGFPTQALTLPLLDAIAAGGADFIEIGMPFSDPLAEGPAIQTSSEVALNNGVTLASTLKTAAEFRKQSDLPIVLMGYINPIWQYGVSNFCRDAHSSGVDGLIIPDVPPAEAEKLKKACDDVGLDLIFLIAPNSTPERIQAIDELSSGFVYAVSITGVTGQALNHKDKINLYLKQAKNLVQKNPLLVGFGIRTAEDAGRLSANTDGFIVGSALVRLIEEYQGKSEKDLLNAVQKFISDLKNGASIV